MGEEKTPRNTSYAAAGVDIDAAERLVSRFADLARATRRPEVIADVGSFGGLFHLGSHRDPVLVASTDSVGTKVKLAALLGRYEGLGHDLVNHCATARSSSASSGHRKTSRRKTSTTRWSATCSPP